MVKVIGLTGGIASGKTTISEMFAQWDIPVVDADVISKEVVEVGKEAYKAIVDAFGEDILLANDEINRKKLGKIIFADEAKRETLNQIVHPAVRKEMLSQRDAYLRDGHDCIVLDIPLLFESNLTHLVDKTIVVAVKEPVQLERLIKRNKLSEHDAKQRINSQMPLSEKEKLADEVIDNNGEIESSCEQLKNILRKWQVID